MALQVKAGHILVALMFIYSEGLIVMDEIKARELILLKVCKSSFGHYSIDSQVRFSYTPFP